MTRKIHARNLFFAALSATALLAAMPRKAPLHIPPDLRDAPADAAGQLASYSSGEAPAVPEAIPVLPEPGNKAIIGTDDRIEFYEAPPYLKGQAEAVAAMALKKLPENAQGKTPPPLCPSERFHDQPALAFCTAFLVGPDLMATAGHCISGDSCANIKFVFDFAVKNPGEVPSDLGPESAAYSCKEVLVSKYTYKKRDPDMALVRLDRPVKDREPLRLNTSGKLVSEGTPVITIGHFLGVPMKISMNGEVRASTYLVENASYGWFATSLDAFPGNSGGPVINMQTGLVEGINVRAGGRTDPDFDISPAGCRVARVYPAEEKWGPESTDIALLLPYLNRLNRR